MSNHLVSPAENSISAAEPAFDFGFDVGTSPHGLPADFPLPNQEALCMDDLLAYSTEFEDSDYDELESEADAPSASQQAKRAEGLPLPEASRQAGSAPARPAQRRGHDFEGKPQEQPLVYRTESVQRSCRSIQEAAKAHYYPLVLTGRQLDSVERAVRVALLDAIAALEDEPNSPEEIQPDIDAYNALTSLFSAVRASRKGTPNENWRGNML